LVVNKKKQVSNTGKVSKRRAMNFLYPEVATATSATPIHCKKELAIFPSPAGMSLTKLSLGGKKLNYSRPGRV